VNSLALPRSIPSGQWSCFSLAGFSNGVSISTRTNLNGIEVQYSGPHQGKLMICLWVPAHEVGPIRIEIADGRGGSTTVTVFAR